MVLMIFTFSHFGDITFHSIRASRSRKFPPTKRSRDPKLSKEKCIYFESSYGFTNKLTIAAAGNYLARQGYNFCGMLWADSVHQAKPFSSEKMLTTPPVDVPYVLTRPKGCEEHLLGHGVRPSIDPMLQERLQSFNTCLIMTEALNSFDTAPEDNIFYSRLHPPNDIPLVDACVHLRNEPDWVPQWPTLSDAQFVEIEQKHPRILIVGDSKWVNPEFLERHHHIGAMSADQNALLSMCACTGKPFYGTEMSSLSINMCKRSSDCHLLAEGQHNPRKYYDQYKKIDIRCI
jgi:hypothetical protein